MPAELFERTSLRTVKIATSKFKIQELVLTDMQF